MRIINNIQNFINEEDIKIIIQMDKINIQNFTEISSFSESFITIKHAKGIINVTGKELMISKLLSEEILISGKLEKIEMG